MSKIHETHVQEVFLIFSLFFELRRLRDQSQIVDLAERIRLVCLRARETFMVPRWWQNKVPISAYLSSCFLNNLCLLSGKYHRRKGVAYIITKYYTVITKYNLYMDSFPPVVLWDRFSRVNRQMAARQFLIPVPISLTGRSNTKTQWIKISTGTLNRKPS